MKVKKRHKITDLHSIEWGSATWKKMKSQFETGLIILSMGDLINLVQVKLIGIISMK